MHALTGRHRGRCWVELFQKAPHHSTFTDHSISPKVGQTQASSCPAPTDCIMRPSSGCPAMGKQVVSWSQHDTASARRWGRAVPVQKVILLRDGCGQGGKLDLRWGCSAVGLAGNE